MTAKHKTRATYLVASVLAAVVIAVNLLWSSARSLELRSQKRARPVSVVMLVFDEFPLASLLTKNGAIDEKTFPNFHALAQRSVWFRNTTTDEAFTKEALPALLTGTRARNLGDLSDIQPQNLFTLLGDAYPIRTPEFLGRFCPLGTCPSTEGRRELEDVPQVLKFFDDGMRGSKFMTFLETLRPYERPHFHFVHLVVPHEPWRYLPSGTLYPEDEPVPGQVDPPGRGRGWGDDRWLVAQAYQRHMLQVKLVDNLVGVLVDHMKDQGIFERSAIVITADHGTAFLPGQPERLANETNIGAVAGIPFFMKLPFQKKGRISDRPVEMIDVLPTLTDVLDLTDQGRGLDGISAFGERLRTRRSLGGVGLADDGSHLDAAIAQKFEVFEEGRGLFEVAPSGTAELLGSRVLELPVGPPTGFTAEVDRAGAYRDASPTEDVFPALLQGTVRGTTYPGMHVAIAIDGRIEVITRTYAAPRDEIAFYAMLPPTAFRDPPNEVRLYLLDPETRAISWLPSSLDITQ